ncbi:hypothetical protein [Paraburkholderia caribensis]|uniref:hypothetical protein n=1 Tax=Paraburkholderia caribensis TaxID=75105 RepID=UPI00078CA273|nr:hypothetical protein [Paraburkholderia caribensis]AMV41748.1 hypothetical protein ATN79_03495 [Paraburkholderia caribensis]
MNSYHKRKSYIGVMRRTGLAALIVASTSIACAQNLSDQDINLMAAAQKAVRTYKQSGVTGIYAAVTQCYGHLRQGHKAFNRSVEFCVALDIGGIFIDSEMASAEGFPRDPRFMDATAADRMNEVLRRYGVTADDDGTRAYFAARVARIKKYTNDAMQLG